MAKPFQKDSYARDRSDIAEYCRLIKHIPVMRRDEAVDTSVRLAAARDSYRREILKCPLASREIYEVLCRVRDGELRFDRYIRVSNNGTMDKDLILGRMGSALQKAKKLIRNGPSEKLSDLLESLSVRIQKFFPLEKTLVQMLSRIDQLAGDQSLLSKTEREGLISDIGEDPDSLRDHLDRASAFRQEYVSRRQALVNGNLRLVVMEVAKSSVYDLPGEDLIQEAVVGLIEAADRYDSSMGFGFASYSKDWIHQTISKAVADKGRLIRLPVHIRQKVRWMKAVIEKVEHESGRSATLELMAKNFGVSEQKASQMKLASLKLQTMQTSVGEHASDVEDFAGHMDDKKAVQPGQVVEVNEVGQSIRRILLGLDYKSRCVIEMRFGLGDGHQYSVEDTAKVIGESQDDVNDIELASVNRLRDPAQALGLDDPEPFAV